MCLGIPGQVVGWVDDQDLLARVEVEGVPRDINIALLQDDGLEVGDWVLIHLGFAMEKLDEDGAREAMEGLKLLNEELQAEITAGADVPRPGGG